MKIRVLKPYQSRGVFYPVDAVITVTEEEAAFLLRDAPGCFAVEGEQPEVRAVETPPVDRMIKQSKRK